MSLKTADKVVTLNQKTEFDLKLSNSVRMLYRDEQALQRFYILTFKNSTSISRHFFNSISINECFISLIFYTSFILFIKRSFEFIIRCLYCHKFLTCGPSKILHFDFQKFHIYISPFFQ